MLIQSEEEKMKKRHYFLGLVYIVFLATIFFNLFLFSSVSIAAQQSKVFKLTLGTWHPAEDPINKVINAAWFKWLEKESNGRIKMTLLPGGQAAPPHTTSARSRLFHSLISPFLNFIAERPRSLSVFSTMK